MTPFSTEQAMQFAIEHHQAGRLAEAEALYREVIAREPEHADALNLLGVLAGQGGRPDIAVELISYAIAINANVAEYHLNLGTVLESQGQIEQAVGSYETALQLRPQ